MEQKVVRRLESEIENAIAESFLQIGERKVPLPPTRHMMHLMAKAAVTVYEAAVENDMRHRNE